jgi:hypothetical protein
MRNQTITRLVIFDEGKQCESTEVREFSSVAALCEWLERVRSYTDSHGTPAYTVRVVC